MTKFKRGDIVRHCDGELSIVVGGRDKDGDYPLVGLPGYAPEGTAYSDGGTLTLTRREPFVVLAKRKRGGVQIRDGYGDWLAGEFMHYLCVSADGKKVVIGAGCRLFSSIKAARKHWTDHEDRFVHLAGNEDKSEELDKQSLAIMKIFERKLTAYRESLKKPKKKARRK